MTSTLPILSIVSQAALAAEVQPLRLANRDVPAIGGFFERLFLRGGALTETAHQTDALMMLIFWFGVFWFVLLMALMVYWVIKYRRVPGVAPQRSPSHNTMLELIWTIVPSSALIVLFVAGFGVYMKWQVQPTSAVELRVEGYKWNWDVTYPNGALSPWKLPLDPGNTHNGGAGVPVLVVPEDTAVRLRMTSRDVIHSFWIPDIRVKMDVFPNRESGFAFTTPALPAGEQYQDHWVFCAEYCGESHSEMAAILRVVKRADYATTLTAWTQVGGTPEQQGQGVANQRGCFACHSVDGSAGSGPTWKNLYGYPGKFVGGSSIEVKDENYLRESILNSGARVVEGYSNAMPNFNGVITGDALENLILYIRSLSDRAPVTDGGIETPPSTDPAADPAVDPAAGTPGDAAQTDPAEPAAVLTSAGR